MEHMFKSLREDTNLGFRGQVDWTGDFSFNTKNSQNKTHWKKDLNEIF